MRTFPIAIKTQAEIFLRGEMVFRWGKKKEKKMERKIGFF